MKKIRKIIAVVFLSGVILSFCIPKGGPDWFRERPKYLTEYPNTYEIIVDFYLVPIQNILINRMH